MALVEQIWKDKAKGEVNPLAFSALAQKLAQIWDIEGRDFGKGKELEKEKYKTLAYQEWLKVKNKGKDKKNKPAQIRKFYDVIFNLNNKAKQKIRTNPEEELPIEILVQLHRQLALVHYAKGRDLVTKSFVEAMEELIKATVKVRDLETITNFLEAVMAYYKECRPKMS